MGAISIEEVLLVLTVIGQVGMGIILADIISGLLHWAEDSYGKEEWPIIGKYVIAPNILHHREPLAFTKPGYIYRNRTTIAAAGVIGLIFWSLGLINLVTITALAVGSQTNEIHKWAHMPPARLPKIVVILQKTGLLQTPRHHFGHHKLPSRKNYCIITNYVNPVLDRLGVFRGLEAMVRLVTGVRPREDGFAVTTP